MKKLIYQENLFGKIPIGITNGKYTIKECSNLEADEIIKKYHYSHKSTPNRFKSFVVNNKLGKKYVSD